mgnify:CR=1 FL=1
MQDFSDPYFAILDFGCLCTVTCWQKLFADALGEAEIHTECGEHRVTHNGQKFQVSLIIISFTEHWHFFLIITLFCVSYSPEYWLVLFYSTCRSFQKGIFDVYVLWPFDKKLMCVNTCDFAVSILLNNLVLKFSKNIYQTHCKISKQPAGNS